ncbi:hypothetical protein FRC09_002124 [Ceratobasidium sp. 395]|nr:hypothetical protein FRC09_002124 [Ceratobasidium sp. 395]
MHCEDIEIWAPRLHNIDFIFQPESNTTANVIVPQDPVDNSDSYFGSTWKCDSNRQLDLAVAQQPKPMQHDGLLKV